jgi:hypothetical protein
MAKLGRPKAEVMLTESERVELIRLTKRARVNRAVAFRARVVLACADAPDSAVVRRLRTTKSTVAKWRLRFIAGRLEGLYDEPRVGAPRIVSDEAVEAVIVKTLETIPKGETHWSTRTMAKAAGMSHTMVGRIWRTFGLQPHVTESFKLSPDPQLVARFAMSSGSTCTRPTMRSCSRSTRNLRSRRSNARNRSCRWTSDTPNDGPTTTCGMARSISSPR